MTFIGYDPRTEATGAPILNVPQTEMMRKDQGKRMCRRLQTEGVQDQGRNKFPHRID
jgi:hypothetical protein